ncbi:hypothetical protein [Flavobacterium sp.]|uniref:hypothetical protein n=1 Tax=Flavobacterium sp. TaxID=239 RepID=UPI0039E272B3
MKNITLALVFMITFSGLSQKSEKLTFNELKNEVIDFMVANKNMQLEMAEKYKSGEYNTFILTGSINQQKEGDLKDGLYQFAPLASHQQVYFVLVEKDNFEILDLSTRKQLDEAIIKVLDFCERKKFCYEISSSYTSVLIKFFYNRNKNPLNGYDVNCGDKKIGLQDLP